MVRKLFVWDFHGVMEKGNDHAVTEITNMALEQHGLNRRMSIAESEALAGRRWHEYFDHLLPDATPEDRLAVAHTCQHISNSSHELIAKYAQPNDHVLDILERIANSAHHQILISNCQTPVLKWYLKHFDIAHYFPEGHYFGLDGHIVHSRTKKDCLTEYLKDKEFSGGLVAIGDSPHDVLLAGCHPNGVGYLYTHPGRTHRDATCRYRINDLRQVLQEV